MCRISHRDVGGKKMRTHFDSHKQYLLTINMKERKELKITTGFWFELLGRKRGGITMYFDRGEKERMSFEYFNFKLDM